jgi:hypothetical protein
LALAFGLLTEHRGVNTAAWMITAVTAAAGVLLIALARTQGQPDSADISNQPVSPGCAPATAWAIRCIRRTERRANTNWPGRSGVEARSRRWWAS